MKFWAQPLRTAHSCSNSAFPETYESLSKKPFSSVPRCKKSASHHPCFTLRGVLLQVARNFEQFVKKGKARHGEVHMPGSMPLTNASNWTSPSGSDSCRQMPMTNGGKTSMKPYFRLATLGRQWGWTAILLSRFCEPGSRKLRRSHHLGLSNNITVSLQE